MARYSAFLGRRVEVHYRAGDILLPASGTFVADSGRSIFLEQHLLQHGQQKQFRWEIPYRYIVSLHEKPEVAASTEVNSVPVGRAQRPAETSRPSSPADPARPSRAAKASIVGDPAINPLRNRPKTA
jgi:hypothetical protein